MSQARSRPPQPSLPAPGLVLFDLDGTLVDSVPDIAYSVDTMLQRLGLATHGEARIRQWVGRGSEYLIQRALLGGAPGEAEASLFDEAYPLFLELYGENASARSRLYPGARVALERFRALMLPLGCVTNKPGRFTEPLLRDLGIRGAFDLVLAGDSLARKKPDPLPLLHAAAHFGVDPARGWMVGDSINDVQAARAAGFRALCVSYGYNHGRSICEAEPDIVVDSLDELADLL